MEKSGDGREQLENHFPGLEPRAKPERSTQSAELLLSLRHGSRLKARKNKGYFSGEWSAGSIRTLFISSISGPENFRNSCQPGSWVAAVRACMRASKLG